MQDSTPLLVAIAAQLLLIFPLVMLVISQHHRLKSTQDNLDNSDKTNQIIRKNFEKEQARVKQLEHDCAELQRRLTDRPTSKELDEFIEDIYRYNKAILQVKPIHVEEVLLRARPPR